MQIIVNGTQVEVQNLNRQENWVSFVLAGKEYTFFNDEVKAEVVKLSKDNTYQVFLDDREGLVEVVAKARPAGQRTVSEGSLTSPMPGKVFKVLKRAGDPVVKGEAILIIEAMKMEHTIRAQKDGNLSKLYYKEGDQVDGGVHLAEIE